jgi:hypothetical protein
VKISILATALAVSVVWGISAMAPSRAAAGETTSGTDFKVLAPIRQGNLTVFPVVVTSSRDTREFLTLDEGLRSGEVVVTEAGSVQPLIRGRNRPIPVHEGAQVNQLVLVNNSKRPLLLLAGEIVIGGKQDRVIGKDRIVPAESEPVDLGVFCVEPGRWVAKSANFGVLGGNMAAPSVRMRAMNDKDQQKVWSSVRSAQSVIAGAVTAPESIEVQATSSYATVMDNKAVRRKLDAVAAPIERDYSRLMRDLRERNAVGVVVAVDGEIIWADIFASTQLLEKYWPKLVRSYATDALVSEAKAREVSLNSAQAFVDRLDGNHETVEREPGLYRHTEINGDGYKVFLLASLLPKMGFDVHIAKMAE